MEKRKPNICLVRRIARKINWTVVFGTLALVSFLFLIGVAGGCDLERESPYWVWEAIGALISFMICASLAKYCNEQDRKRKARIRNRERIKTLARQLYEQNK